MEKWLVELSEKGINIENIRSKPFQKTAKTIGVENAIRLFRELHGDYMAVGTEYLKDLQREYCRQFSIDKTERELASILRLSAAQVNAIMNEPTAKSPKSLKIEMFPEYGRSKI